MLSKKNKGITLVALVITIIILLILAGISISALTNTGIFEKAKEAKGKSENAQKQEESLLTNYESELIKYAEGDKWDGKVNKPELMTGMKAIQFNDPTDSTEGSVKEVTDSSKNDWYNYDEKKWANAQTEDGSMWVWIPRYAYKVVYNDPNDKSKGGKFDIVFLIGITDNYIDDNGNIQTAQRQTEKNQVIGTDSTKTDKYTVHPAFTNESNIDYANGGWKEELTGIWVAKFEAGYFDKEKEKGKIKSSSVNYSKSKSLTIENKYEDARNYLDGIYGEETKSIKYPTFQGEKYSMNFINNNDAFNISRNLTESKNIYGFDDSITDSHLMKNSEWGTIVYLGESKYGLDGENIRINNVNVEDNINFVYAMTGYAAKTEDEKDTKINNNVYKWTTKDGTVASNTGTIYGVYDMSGGVWERISALINNENSSLHTYGESIMSALNNGKASEYVMVYKNEEKNVQNADEVDKTNYNLNIQVYGDAMAETSSSGIGNTGWNQDYSSFARGDTPFFTRGGGCWDTSNAGLYGFFRTAGINSYDAGFRPVLVAK